MDPDDTHFVFKDKFVLIIEFQRFSKGNWRIPGLGNFSKDLAVLFGIERVIQFCVLFKAQID